MRKDIQKRGGSQLPRREEWARSVRGVRRRGTFCPHLVDKQILLLLLTRLLDQTTHGGGEKAKAG